jgi:F0F1-type ATP synthase membrane subunit b/b'
MKDYIKKNLWLIWIPIAFVVFCLLRKYVFKKNHNPIINFLEKQVDKGNKEIKKIDARINKRKLLKEIVKERHVEMDEKISRMSDDQLDKHLKRLLR